MLGRKDDPSVQMLYIRPSKKLAWGRRYIVALRKIPLSVAAPSVALSYAIVAAVGWYWFKETLSPRQIAGIGAIMVGVILLNGGSS